MTAVTADGRGKRRRSDAPAAAGRDPVLDVIADVLLTDR
jgi:hypothetical protein